MTEIVRATPEEIAEEAKKPPMITVRGDILAPLLVYVRKFFQSVEHHNANGMSRFMHSEDYQLTVSLRGFTPEDWSAMQSLARSAGADLEEVLDALAGQTPQMAKPELHARGGVLSSLARRRPIQPKQIGDAQAEANKLIERMTGGEEAKATK